MRLPNQAGQVPPGGEWADLLLPAGAPHPMSCTLYVSLRRIWCLSRTAGTVQHLSRRRILGFMLVLGVSRLAWTIQHLSLRRILGFILAFSVSRTTLTLAVTDCVQQDTCTSIATPTNGRLTTP
jgi:hypothetical protein